MIRGLCGSSGNTHGRRWKGPASALLPGPAGNVQSPNQGSPASHLFAPHCSGWERSLIAWSLTVPPALPRPPSLGDGEKSTTPQAGAGGDPGALQDVRSFLLLAPAKAPGSSHRDRAEKSSCCNVSGVKRSCLVSKEGAKSDIS